MGDSSGYTASMPVLGQRRMLADEEEDDTRRYGSEANMEMLKKILSKLILCVEMENWEKAEGFADTVKQLTAEAPREAKSAALRLKMAIQKENYEKTAAAFETLNALME